MEWQFFVELVTNGMLTGLMYALVAVGFVLIYKSTDAINFAQGEFCMIAAIVVAGAIKLYGFPVWVAIGTGLLFMLVFNWGLERVVLRPMIGRPVVAIIMATIGLALMFRGLGPLVFGAETRPIPLPIPDQPIIWGPFFMAPIDVLGAVISIGFMAVFGWFFMKSRKGVAMRAVADSHQVSMAMGINVERYFVLAWMLAGFVALLGGLVWGSAIGVDTQLAALGLKVFPVVILGGLDSIVGVIVGGIIVGVVEAISAGYIDPFVGGGTKDFTPYVLMILVLMVRPYGIFGKPIIERI
ncbi:MAG: branched-chain amino acid ABC transporter permease [Rhodospirillaceae bacterium]|jgi:branched-chain amino acid transport system permease protein|nr:branched-chain amino acid ABC transporter permease [Rhodospirillaceae bacterium]MBT4045307.1 branched-chain amino acid ABC transporter permease [Rhodospirillaceae bacterium]MBT4487788.1 branched-chain amino acid ABC transporter permease [Rhodospirillaceae bacterium]MBT5193084.1 branched-chain amino acid ABC transporter permease [Rhodospirillaceae bacterium]MBT5898692.1 branched-chain amino acid ABC transporter permease [Rhodospirillaceae bacterium]